MLDKECSKCGALNESRNVFNTGEIMIECIKCGHRKTIGTYETASSTQTPETFIIPELPEKEIF